MNTVAFDTYRFVKHLTASGFTEQQAEALAEEQTAVLNGNLATKADIELVKAELKAIKWAIGIVLAVAALQMALTLRFLS